MLSLIMGIGIVAFLFLYLALALDKEHFIMKLLLIIFAVIVITLIPKTTLDDVCESRVNETITIGNNTAYIYDTVCIDVSSNKTDITFHKIITSFFWIFWIYVFVYFVYTVLKWFGVIISKK